ncbi:MAG: gluconate 2-dehydrogenase subunit 3 family protein [Tannerellaceae bacterium]|nr:gluconate 2-dehydrogenase subunit 3 family protein [Tannerellaceae bacterium]
MRITRRKFLQSLGLLYGSVLYLPSCRRNDSEYRVFTSSEADTLIALCEQIIPADHDPGATDAGVIYFIDRLLHQRFPELLPVYQYGLKALDQSVRELYGFPFISLSSGLQMEVLKKMEMDELPATYWKERKSSSFFNQVIRNTMQGFYGSPRHGGNKNYASYRMLKLDFPLVVGQNRYNHGR